MVPAAVMAAFRAGGGTGRSQPQSKERARVEVGFHMSSRRPTAAQFCLPSSSSLLRLSSGVSGSETGGSWFSPIIAPKMLSAIASAAAGSEMPKYC